MHGGRRAVCRSLFSPSTMWVPGIELSSSGLVASSYAQKLSHHPRENIFMALSFSLGNSLEPGPFSVLVTVKAMELL